MVTDHRPLLTLLGPTKGVLALAANGLSRWDLVLNQYDYSIEYRSTKHHQNADALSRLPVGPDKEFDAREDEEDVDTVCTIHTIGQQLNSSDYRVLAKETKKDPILATVMRYTAEGYWSTLPSSYKWRS